MAKQPRPKGPRLAIITNGGGPGVMATDALARYDLEPAILSQVTFEALDDILPPFWSRNNPIDILGDASGERYAKVVDICLKEKNLHGLLIILAPQAMTDPVDVAEHLKAIQKKSSFPVFTSWMGGRDVARAKDILNQAGIPTYDTPEKAVDAFLYMVKYTKNLEMLMEIPPRLFRDLEFDRQTVDDLVKKTIQSEKRFLTEVDSKTLLNAYGIAVNTMKTVSSAEEAIVGADRLGYPLVMKLVSPDITHKTEANGVQLDLRSHEDVKTAYGKIMDGAKAYKPDARIEGVSLQSYISQPDVELLIGAKQDENFGPIILFGMGGIYTEVLKDRSLGLPPMNRLLARRLMEETRVYSLLQGYRNRPAVNMELLEEMIIRLAQLMIDFPEIVELDMNPVIVKDGLPRAVDARILLKPVDIRSPNHLVISPYPERHESSEITTEGFSIFVRPIKPEDAPLLLDLFDTLSPTSIYFRFFGPLKSLPHSILVRFTQVDYDREIDLVALVKGDSGEDKMIGVARIFSDPDGKKAEFAILVGDPWQGKGVGARLLERSLRIAKERGIETIWGTVLKENQNMLALGQKLGFKISRSSEPGEMELTIDLLSSKVELES